MQDERKLLAAYDDGEHEPEGQRTTRMRWKEEIDEDEEDEEISVSRLFRRRPGR